MILLNQNEQNSGLIIFHSWKASGPKCLVPWLIQRGQIMKEIFFSSRSIFQFALKYVQEICSFLLESRQIWFYFDPLGNVDTCNTYGDNNCWLLHNVCHFREATSQCRKEIFVAQLNYFAFDVRNILDQGVSDHLKVN